MLLSEHKYLTGLHILWPMYVHQVLIYVKGKAVPETGYEDP
jgi:hypothetical protein